jgi:hypothetical protein
VKIQPQWGVTPGKQIINNNEGKVEGRLEVTGGRGRRRKLLLDDLLRKRYDTGS